MSGKTYWGTPLRIVYDPHGREVWRGDAASVDHALAKLFNEGEISAVDLMVHAGYTVREAPRMVEVQLDDLERVLRFCPETSDGMRARLRAIVDREREKP